MEEGVPTSDILSIRLSTEARRLLDDLCAGASPREFLEAILPRLAEANSLERDVSRLAGEVEDAETRLDELVAELEDGQELVAQRRAAENLIAAKVAAADEVFARAVEQEARLDELNRAAAGMRRQLAWGETLRRMNSPDEAQSVGISEMIEVVLQPIATWLDASGVGEAVAVRAPEAVRSKHSFGLEWKLPPNQLLWWLAAALWRAEEAAAATGIGGGEK